LYSTEGSYAYKNGWNRVAVVAFLVGVLPNVPGFLNAAFPLSFPAVSDVLKTLYTYAWFVGLALSALSYLILMKASQPRMAVSSMAN
jgi:NCS1 family nucleobase:cation symporter-1